eukprot:3783237-Rhodomonas_salina.1
MKQNRYRSGTSFCFLYWISRRRHTCVGDEECGSSKIEADRYVLIASKVTSVPYNPLTPCPVLSFCMLLRGVGVCCYAMPGTDTPHAATVSGAD